MSMETNFNTCPECAELKRKLVALQKNFDMQAEWLAEWKRVAEALKASQPKIVIKGMTELTYDQAVVALDSAMAIIESVGTTGIDSKWQDAHKWMLRYYPNWS